MFIWLDEICSFVTHAYSAFNVFPSYKEKLEIERGMSVVL